MPDGTAAAGLPSLRRFVARATVNKLALAIPVLVVETDAVTHFMKAPSAPGVAS